MNPLVTGLDARSKRGHGLESPAVLFGAHVEDGVHARAGRRQRTQLATHGLCGCQTVTQRPAVSRSVNPSQNDVRFTEAFRLPTARLCARSPDSVDPNLDFPTIFGII